MVHICNNPGIAIVSVDKTGIAIVPSDKTGIATLSIENERL